MPTKHTTIRFTERDIQNIKTLGIHLTKKGVYGLVSRDKGVLTTALLRYLIEQEMIRNGLMQAPERDWLEDVESEESGDEE
jgi:hypothetical protein